MRRRKNDPLIKSKVYEEVLKEIRNFIGEHQFSPGDKLPSERELAEQLNAGRSSVREALRAMELLGLIETRRGEGTFLRAYRPFHLIELLSTFVLQESKTKDELIPSKMILEKEAIKLAMFNINEKDIDRLGEAIHELVDTEKHIQFFSKIFEYAGNDLLLKMWQLLDEFTRTVHTLSYCNESYTELLSAMKERSCFKVDSITTSLYDQKLSKE